MTDPDCSDPAAPAGVRSAEYALEDLPAGLGRAEFRMTLACAGPPRATVVLVPGSNCDGRELADDPAWQAWAAARGLALLGVWLQDPPDSPEPWIEAYSRAERGSGECLERAVCELAARLGAGDLGGKPLAIVGSSAGGQFAYEFACWRPARVLAFVAHKGGVYFTHLAPAEARALPGLFFIGGLDSLHRRLSLTGVWSMGRRAGACWALVDEPDAGHEEARFGELSRVFLDDALALRLADGGLAPVSFDDGWLIHADGPVSACDATPEVREMGGWLPGPASARAASPLAPAFHAGMASAGNR